LQKQLNRIDIKLLNLHKMKYTENSLNILCASTYKGVGKAWIHKNLKGNEPSAKIVALLNDTVCIQAPITIYNFEQQKQALQIRLEKMEHSTDGIVAIGDQNFPAFRGNVKQSEQPIYLFYKGNLDLLQKDNRNVAVIGLLHPDTDIENTERKVVAELAKQNITIVSGLAHGCDAIAHKQALDSNGKTVAILPSTLNYILPTTHKALAAEIVEQGGLLITEYIDEVQSKFQLSARYKERDRLQALYSDSIILSASYAKNNLGLDSGSRLALEYAYNYNIPRAVIYNEALNANNPMFDLNRQLIREDKKVVVIGEWEIEEKVAEVLGRKEVVVQGGLFG
jgi:DNA processing protein